MKAIEAANFFIALADSRDGHIDDGVSDMKLQKLLYFAQEASLRKTGRPLFDDPIEAWQYGPVVPRVYREFKKFGRSPIPSRQSLEEAARVLSADDVELLADVYSRLADKSAAGLMELTHQPGTPWSQVYNPPKDERITVESIRDYAQRNSLWEGLPPYLQPTEVTPMKNGRYTLPADWDDDD